jgi:hypothetical protein
MKRGGPTRAVKKPPYQAAQQIEDLNERRNAVAAASRDMRYFAERLRNYTRTELAVEMK